MGANLRAILAGVKWPDEPEYLNMQKKFDIAFDTISRGTLISDILSWASTVETPKADKIPVSSLSATEYDAFVHRVNSTASVPYVRWDDVAGPNTSLSNRVKEIRSIKVSGTTFSNSLTSKNKGDGYVLFRSPLITNSNHEVAPVLAGRIERIFLHSHLEPGTENVITEPYLVIREYQNLTEDHAKLDPFSRIPYLETKLCYNSFEDQRHVVMAADLVSHFASFVYKPDDIDCDCIVVLSLDRVGGYIIMAVQYLTEKISRKGWKKKDQSKSNQNPFLGNCNLVSQFMNSPILQNESSPEGVQISVRKSLYKNNAPSKIRKWSEEDE